MKVFFLSCAMALILSACSSKTQTNPLPNEKKYFVPKNMQMILKNEVNLTAIENFDLAAEEILMRRNKGAYEKTIWQIGLDRGHYE
ncbi:hypothetical protein CCZ01_09355 [Helicobacter monodelphidis]|uniref:hypothetical protein n=1 Tax=Helicobacter sp. 15-1451 TaxID=2004995 RepID=UPI000DCEB5AF|nr:hypothetical protein [Helicobacter sp. 15-1451]RAX56491.1 hypothetical protein CCZ01_09355 [Helicobacter sp. 15-1451]